MVYSLNIRFHKFKVDYNNYCCCYNYATVPNILASAIRTLTMLFYLHSSQSNILISKSYKHFKRGLGKESSQFHTLAAINSIYKVKELT